MLLPSNLPQPPPHVGPDIIHANEILAKGYEAAKNVLGLVQPDVHQARYHRERVSSEFIPLLDAMLNSVSDTGAQSWCYAITTIIATLFNQLIERETSAQNR